MIPQPVRFGDVEQHEDRPPPTPGANTRDVLQECGFTDDAIDRFVSAGVIGDGSRAQTG